MEVLLLDEDDGIKKIRQIYGRLAESMASGGEVTLDLGRLKRLDASLAQLLVVAARDFHARKTPLRLRSVSPVIRGQLELCGIVK